MPNSKKFPYGFLIALLLILVFEFANACFDNYFYSPAAEWPFTPFEGLRLKLKNDLALSKEKAFDIIILGDSHGHISIIPKTIEEKTLLTCFNFSLFGAQGTLAPYWMFRNYLKSHDTKPKYVIVEFSPFLEQIYPPEEISANALTRFYDFKKGNIKAFIEEYGVVKGIKFMLPSLKHQERLKDFIKNPLAVEIPSKTQLADFSNQFYFDKGYYPKEANKSYPPKSKESGYEAFFRFNIDKFSMSPFMQKYLRGILDLAKENQIKIIYYIPPHPPYLYDIPKVSGYIRQHDDFINSLKKEYPDFFIINPRDMFKQNDLFLDIYHLNGKGAPLLSEFLAGKINELNRQE